MRQVCTPWKAPRRGDIIERARRQERPSLARRARRRSLRSLDNRRFSRFHAELAAAATLRAGGWRLDGPALPGGPLRRPPPDGRAVNVLPFGLRCTPAASCLGSRRRAPLPPPLYG
ncbi:MAG: hypothetical protein IPI35_21270 [Deltaproteobacteria bacterium]|nr:hypothetical protein [Deltaproteobacteria bacterium]